MKQNALFEKLKKEIYPAVRKDVEESMIMKEICPRGNNKVIIYFLIS